MWRKQLTRRQQILNNKRLYFNFDNASYTFLSIFNNYNNYKNGLKQQKETNIVNLFDKERKKAEKKETEEDYIFNDMRKERRIKQELPNGYGEKSNEKHHEVDSSKYKVKLNKNLFMDMFDDNSFQNNNSIKVSNKILTLPQISNERISKAESISIEVDEQINKHNDKSPNGSSFVTINYEGSLTEPNIVNSQFESLNNSNLNSDVNKSIYSINLPIIKKNKKPKNFNYIQILDIVKRDFMKKEKSYRHLFNKYNYGINLSNQKYKFVMKKYFQ
jgi:hypothetical protein